MKNSMLSLLALSLIGFSIEAKQDQVEYYSSDPQAKADLERCKITTNSGPRWDRECIKQIKEKYAGKIVEHVVPEDED